MSIRHEPAECPTWCQDEYCPYIHHETWYVIGEDDGEQHGPFDTRAEAVECNRQHLLPDT